MTNQERFKIFKMANDGLTPEAIQTVESILNSTNGVNNELALLFFLSKNGDIIITNSISMSAHIDKRGKISKINSINV